MAGKKTGKRLLTWVLVLVMALSLLPLNALAKDVWSTEYGWIRIYLDDATKNDLEALNGLSKQVRIVSTEYPGGMHACAPLSDYWWTENNAYKVTAKKITSIDLAGDKAIGSSNKIPIPIHGNETYDVEVSEGERHFGIRYPRIVISKRTPKAPDAPNYENLKTLIGGITVNCTNTKASHAGKNYTLIEDSYTTSKVAGDAANGYTYTVTINSQKYVEQFDSDTSATHTPKDATATVTLEYKNSAWLVKSGTPISFNVECNAQPEPDPTPATVTLSDDEGKSLIKKHLTVNGDGLAENTYFVAKLEAVNALAKGVLPDSLSCSTGYMTATGNDVFTFNNANNGNILTFSATGEYTFKVTEENLGVEHMQYDPTVYTMIVNVTPNDGNTALVATVSFKNGEDPVNEGYITFNNTYAPPTPATVTLKETDANGNALIKKHLTITAKEAETIKDAYFCVAVTAANDATEAVFTAEPRYATTTTVKDMTRTSDGTAVEGSFVFPEQSVLTFTEEGTYTFTVKEVFDEYIKVNHTTYDDTEYTMTVTVTEDEGENKLNAAVSFTKGEGDPTSNITFNNIYKTPVIPTYTFDLSNQNTIKVDKKFVSKYGRSAEKSFTATVTIEKETYTAEVDPNFPLNPNVPNNRSAVTAEPTYIGKATGTVTLKTGKTTKAFDFGKESKFQLEPGDYRITVEETKGGDRYVTYDDATYTYEFTVDNEGKINIDTPITCTFTNKYTKRHSAATPSKPTLNTGDHYAYVMGYPDGTVRPNGSITRAEVSAILFRLLSDKTRDEYFTTESSFTDVKAGAWYNNSIATLEKAGVIVDTAKGGAFRPNEAITRAELAAMLAQFSDAKPVKGVKFSDVSAEHWAYEAIAIAAKTGWIEGYPDGTFRPDATITRAEMMTLVNRALERVPSDEDHLLSKRVMLTFPDCKSGDWFYIAVQEATNSHTYERAATEKNGDEQWTALRANRDWTLLEK